MFDFSSINWWLIAAFEFVIFIILFAVLLKRGKKIQGSKNIHPALRRESMGKSQK